MKKIGLIGFFNAGALSDDLILDATKRHIKRVDPSAEIDENVMWKCVKEGKVNVDYLNSFNLLIIGGGSLLGKCTFQPVNSIANWIGKVKTPIAIFGTGYRYEKQYDPLPEAMRERMRILFDRAYPIMLRGKKSVYQCEKNGISVKNVTCLGEPIIGAGYKVTVRRQVLGGNVRNMPPDESQYTNNAGVQAQLAKIYDWLIDATKCDLELLSFREVPGDSDFEGIKKVVQLMKNKARVQMRVALRLDDLLCQMNHCFWFGARCHPAVYAAAIGTSFVGYECQFNKMEDFLSVHDSNLYITPFKTLNDFKGTYFDAHNPVNRERLAESIRRNGENIRGFVSSMLEAAN